MLGVTRLVVVEKAIGGGLLQGVRLRAWEGRTDSRD